MPFSLSVIGTRHVSFSLALAGHTTHIDFNLSYTQCDCIVAFTTKRQSHVSILENTTEDNVSLLIKSSKFNDESRCKPLVLIMAI